MPHVSRASAPSPRGPAPATTVAPDPQSLLDTMEQSGAAERSFRAHAASTLGLDATAMLAARHLVVAKLEGRAVLQRDLVDELQVTGHAVAEVVGRLEGLGFVSRSRREDNRRLAVVESTERLDVAMAEAYQRAWSLIVEVADAMTPQARRAVALFFARLADVLEDEASPDAGGGR